MTDRQSFLVRVASKVRELVAKDVVLQGSEQVYYDLKVSGADMFLLISWIGREYDVDFRAFDVGNYSPGEGSVVGPLLELLGSKPYAPLSINDLFLAVQTGRWPPKA